MSIKRIFLFVADVISLLWRLLPPSLRTLIITGILVLESRNGNVEKGLARLFHVRDKVDWIINERSMVYGLGEHPKHRLTGYHDFFIGCIHDGDAVLDIGCGYGAVARSIAFAYSSSNVVGIDRDAERLELARASENPPNLSFIDTDATISVPSGPWRVVVLSNVLEHIVDRVNFLKKIQKSTEASRFLIRVPLFERDWQMALRRELGVDFRSDEDHKIEHSLEEFLAEITAAGLIASRLQTIWGEIWADCRLIAPLE